METEERKLYQFIVLIVGLVIVLVVLGGAVVYNWKAVRMAELGYNETATIGSRELVYQRAK